MYIQLALLVRNTKCRSGASSGVWTILPQTAKWETMNCRPYTRSVQTGTWQRYISSLLLTVVQSNFKFFMLLTLEEMRHATAIVLQHKKHLNTALCWNSSLLHLTSKQGLQTDQIRWQWRNILLRPWLMNRRHDKIAKQRWKVWESSNICEICRREEMKNRQPVGRKFLLPLASKHFVFYFIKAKT